MSRQGTSKGSSWRSGFLAPRPRSASAIVAWRTVELAALSCSRRLFSRPAWFHARGQALRVVDGNLPATGSDVPLGRKPAQRTRHDLAGGSEMRRDLLLGHLDPPVARRVK